MTRDNCLVTGGTGFLGLHVVRRLEEMGNTVTVLTRCPTNGRRDLVGDLTTADLDLGSQSFRAVYHLAGLAHLVPRTEEEHQKFFLVNVEGTKNLLTALQRSDHLPEVVVLISTVAVYGIEEGALLDEATPCRATDAYGASKRQEEDIVREWCARYGVRAAVVRLPLVAGKGAPGNLGAMVRALRRGRYLGVGSGAARRSMVLASDVGAILPRVAETSGVFHLTDGYHPSFAELETVLAGALGRKQPRRLSPRLARLGARIGDAVQGISGLRMPFTGRTLRKMTATLTFSDKRARQDLGWKPSYVLDHAAEMVG